MRALPHKNYKCQRQGIHVKDGMGANRPSARLSWEPPADSVNVAGYRVYWRLTDSPTWDNSRWVGNATEHTLHGIIIDNYFFGVVAVGPSGNESAVVFPGTGR